MMGLGMGLTVRTLRMYPEPFSFKFSRTAPVSFVFLFASLGFTAFAGALILFVSEVTPIVLAVPLRGFKFSRSHAALLLVIYSAFLLCGIMTEAGVMPHIPIGPVTDE